MLCNGREPGLGSMGLFSDLWCTFLGPSKPCLTRYQSRHPSLIALNTPHIVDDISVTHVSTPWNSPLVLGELLLSAKIKQTHPTRGDVIRGILRLYVVSTLLIAWLPLLAHSYFAQHSGCQGNNGDYRTTTLGSWSLWTDILTQVSPRLSTLSYFHVVVTL